MLCAAGSNNNQITIEHFAMWHLIYVITADLRGLCHLEDVSVSLMSWICDFKVCTDLPYSVLDSYYVALDVRKMKRTTLNKISFFDSVCFDLIGSKGQSIAQYMTSTYTHGTYFWSTDIKEIHVFSFIHSLHPQIPQRSQTLSPQRRSFFGDFGYGRLLAFLQCLLYQSVSRSYKIKSQNTLSQGTSAVSILVMIN